MATILLVEDEPNIASFIKRGLEEFNHSVTIASNGEEGWNLICQNYYELILTDIIMPKLDGWQLCKKFRVEYGYDTPIIMLTALDTTEEIVKGLDAGADDYLVKPFSFHELQARIKALLRRNGFSDSKQELTFGDITLQPLSRKVIRNGTSIDLTIKEYKLLEILIQEKGKAVSRADLMRKVWNKEIERNSNLVDVYVNYLRSKLDKGFTTKKIKTVVGVGYMFEE